MEPPMDLLISN